MFSVYHMSILICCFSNLCILFCLLLKQRQSISLHDLDFVFPANQVKQHKLARSLTLPYRFNLRCWHARQFNLFTIAGWASNGSLRHMSYLFLRHSWEHLILSGATIDALNPLYDHKIQRIMVKQEIPNFVHAGPPQDQTLILNYGYSHFAP